MSKKEKRKFTIHNREYWLAKDEVAKEMGCSKDEAEKLWKAAKTEPRTVYDPTNERKAAKKTVKRETPLKPAEPVAAITEEKLLEALKTLEGDITSTRLRDHFGTNRSYIRRVMKRLQAEGKVKIEIKGKKQQVYKPA